MSINNDRLRKDIVINMAKAQINIAKKSMTIKITIALILIAIIAILLILTPSSAFSKTDLEVISTTKTSIGDAIRISR